MEPRLTIVLPMKGRELFTLRFLWHAEKAQLPYRFLIADGQVQPELARLLENPRAIFPTLDIEYIRYPDDTDYSRFFAKLADAMRRVRTPYAMLADNDDFLGFGGIEQALDFLDNNADYVGARGRTAAFSVYSGLGNSDDNIRGSLNRLHLSYDFEDVSAPTAAERLRIGGLCLGIYYAVHRTEALATICREAAEIDFTDLMLYETYHAMRALTLGKVRTNKGTISYFRQIGTSITYQPSRDWVRDLLRSRFTSDAHAIVERISLAAAAADGGNQAAIAEDVRTIIERYIREFLWMNYSLTTEIKRVVRGKWPVLVRHIQNRPRLFAGRDRAALFGQMAAAGAMREYLDRSREELAEIERALSPQAFAGFSGALAPNGPCRMQASAA